MAGGLNQNQWVLAGALALVVFLLLWMFAGDSNDAADEIDWGEPIAPRTDEAMKARGPETPAPVPHETPAPEDPDPDAAPRKPLTGKTPQPEPTRRAELPETPKKEKDEGPGSTVLEAGQGPGIRETVAFAKDFGLIWLEEAKDVAFGYPKDKTLSEAFERAMSGPVNLITEWPVHRLDVGAYGIDRYEVTNAQYRRFLDRHALYEYTTRISDYHDADRTVPAMVKLARFMVRRYIPTDRSWRAADGIGWINLTRQLYEANRRTIWKAYPDQIARDPETEEIDEEKTWHTFLHKEMRSGLELVFYDIPPPPYWPSMTYPAGYAAHPVRFVTHEQATAFAYWAGKHLPTEREWEYAARGPDSWTWPWGEDAGDFAKRVNGGRVLEEEQLPTTLAVNSMPAGASWCGCMHMLGNAAEWTGTAFRTYPDWVQIPDPALYEWAAVEGLRKHFVMRGGSAADQDPIYTRPTFRGFFREPEDAPEPDDAAYYHDPRPLPTHALHWTGFRCARYEEPGRSRLRHIALRARRSPLIYGARDVDDVSGARLHGAPYAAAEVVRWIERDRRGNAGVYVEESAISYVFVPLLQKAGARAVPDGSTMEELLKQSADDKPIVLGLIQQDFEARNTRRGSADTSACPPGTFVLTLQNGQLLLSEVDDGRKAWVLSSRPVRRQHLKVLSWRLSRKDAPKQPIARIRIDERSNVVQFEAVVPWSTTKEHAHALRIRFQLEPPRGSLAAAGDWQLHQDE